jgi:arylsulfatase A-like enzyme
MNDSSTSPKFDVAATGGTVVETKLGEPRTAAGAGPVALIMTAVCFGLATGMVELVILALFWHYDPTKRLGLRLVNRHYLWMIPSGHVFIFGACGLVLGLFARARPKIGVRLAGFVLFGLSSLALFLVIPELHKVTYLLLAGGVACVAGPLLAARMQRLSPRLGRTLVWQLFAVAGLALASYGREVVSEARARTRLPAAAPGALNVLLVVLDTVRADALSLYGYDRDTSPNLERFARRGVRFERARATAPWTLPSHASMFTGRWPHQFGVATLRPLGAQFPTLAEVLAAEGYLTAGFVANSVFCHADYGLGRGFLHYEDIPVSAMEVIRAPRLGERLLKVVDFARYKLSEYFGDELLVRVFGDDPRVSLADSRSRKSAARINRDALKWISAQQGRPFFAFVNYIDSHDPYIPPRLAEGSFGRKPSTPSERALIRDWASSTSKVKPPPPAIKLARDCYDDCLAYLDNQLGHLFSELDLRGLLENTLVLITSDHGEHFGEHAGVLGHRHTVYSQEIAVPLLVIGPRGVPSGHVVSEPVSLRDLPATIVDLAGLDGVFPFPGCSLARYWDPGGAGNLLAASPAFAENERVWRPQSHSERFRHSLVVGDMLYIRNAHGDEELYNIKTDPAEAHNLAGFAEFRPMLEQFRTAMRRVLADDTVPAPGADRSTEGDEGDQDPSVSPAE